MTRGRRHDLTGKRFGNLKVLPNSMRNKDGDLCWLTECTCGARTWKAGKNLMAGKIKSCSFAHRWIREGEGV